MHAILSSLATQAAPPILTRPGLQTPFEPSCRLSHVCQDGAREDPPHRPLPQPQSPGESLSHDQASLLTSSPSTTHPPSLSVCPFLYLSLPLCLSLPLSFTPSLSVPLSFFHSLSVPLAPQVVISDVDVLWLRDPLPYFKNLPEASPGEGGTKRRTLLVWPPHTSDMLRTNIRRPAHSLCPHFPRPTSSLPATI
jgi:hypothetical protein